MLTGYLAFILGKFADHLHIITPADPTQRGCQLSIIVKENGKQLFDFLETQGILPDWREPDVIRMSPVPLYNSFEDVFKIGVALEAYFEKEN
jgi:kynureninase